MVDVAWKDLPWFVRDRYLEKTWLKLPMHYDTPIPTPIERNENWKP